MPRDSGLEMVLEERLASTPGVTTRAMFGGLAYMVRGNLVFGARKDSLLIRLGKGNDAWALALPGISAMAFETRTMHGWVRVTPEVYGDDALREQLFAAAIAFAGTLPAKP